MSDTFKTQAVLPNCDLGQGVKATATITGQDITEHELLNEARIIWDKVKASKINPRSTECDKYYDALRNEYKNFAKSYPIVLRYMVHWRQYSEKAFVRYLGTLKVKPWKSQADFINSQSDYVVLLYKATTPHWDKKKVAELRKYVTDTLTEERAEFERIGHEAEEKVAAKEKILRAMTRTEFAEHIMHHMNHPIEQWSLERYNEQAAELVAMKRCVDSWETVSEHDGEIAAFETSADMLLK